MTDADERELEILIRLIDIEITLARRHEGREYQANRRRRRRRQLWTREWLKRRTIFGQYETLLQELNREDPGGYKNFLRVDADLFEELLRRVGPSITKKTTNWREPLDPGLKLAITLRHMATGATFRQLMYSFRVADNTISKFIPTVLEAIIDTFQAEVMPPLIEPDQWREVSDRFNTKWNFPHACGALDGKHIPIKAPPKSGSLYHNYKGFFSMILLALADADYKFIWVSVAEYGSASDCQVFNDSELKELVEGGELGFPDSEPLPGLTENLPYFFLGDDAFPLRRWMMKPYSRIGLGHDERIFNYRLSRARRVVENAFGILANRFQCLLNATVYKKTESVKSLVLACVMLHNLLRIRYPGVPANADQEDQNHALVPGVWRDEGQLVDAGVHAGRNVDHNLGKQQRNYLRDYFMSEAGSVPWQELMI